MSRPARASWEGKDVGFRPRLAAFRGSIPPWGFEVTRGGEPRGRDLLTEWVDKWAGVPTPPFPECRPLGNSLSSLTSCSSSGEIIFTSPVSGESFSDTKRTGSGLPECPESPSSVVGRGWPLGAQEEGGIAAAGLGATGGQKAAPGSQLDWRGKLGLHPLSPVKSSVVTCFPTMLPVISQCSGSFCDMN